MKIYQTFAEVKDLWKSHASHEALSQIEFYLALEKSGSIGEEAGWMPLIVADENDGVLFAFIKGHSYGEFIFDWEWARAYERHGVPYYPKITSMVPLTPVKSSHFIMKEFSVPAAGRLLTELESFYQKYNLSSLHFLFVTDTEKEFFESQGYFIRESFQYHFENHYQNFEDFLSHLKTKKAKNLRSEREFSDVTFKQYTGDELTRERANQMHEFYLSTIDKKESFAYLRPDFFELLFETMKDQILYVEASRGGPVAGTLFYYDTDRLLGRYWGSTADVQNLHFEMSYYQGMDFCFSKGIPLFEAGAQGEHKISRGFKPVKIFSAHKIKNPAFDQAIKTFVEAEKNSVKSMMDQLAERLPFKT